MNEPTSLQDMFAPNLVCFGCGPANQQGLQLKSFVDGDTLIATFVPQPQHRAFEGMINGGIIGTLLDCHMNWAAAWNLMNVHQLDTPPCTVTAEYKVGFKLPTPDGRPLKVVAWVVDSTARKAVTKATLSCDGIVTAEGDGIFVSVKEGHPAYHRW